MSLGETINRLRTEKNMSQGDLADALDVSRQSVSKWETDASVPDLDRLVKLSELFGVSLDELVKGKPPEFAASPPPEPQIIIERVVEQRGMAGRKIAGTVLLCMAFAVVILCTLMGGLLEGLVLCLPFLICGLICFAAKKHPGLWCAWALFLMVDGYLRYGTGLNWAAVRWTLQWEQSWNYTRLVIAWCQLLCGLGVMAATIVAFRQGQFMWTKRNRGLFLCGCILFILLCLPFSTWIFLAGGLPVSGLVTFAGWLQDSLRLMLLAALLTAVVRWLRGRKTT